MTVPILTYRHAARDRLLVDLDRLMISRLLIQANSGGGKSRAIRQLLEETFGKVQHIVIDPEGEFPTLREKYPYVLASKHGGEALASPKTAKLLCRRLMESGASAVLDLYELPPDERKEFVRIFLSEMTALPKTLWRPCLVVIDEAHTFAPEKGHGESVSTDAVINFISLSRKRGFCPVLATQRISKLHKDAAAELNNKMIGRTGLDVDVERAAKELGFDKEKRQTLRRLEPGSFYVYGPAISPEVTVVLTGDVETTHPEPGQVSAAPPPAPAKVKAMLSQLVDLPKEAEEEARSIADLQRANADLTRKLRHAEKAVPSAGVHPAEIDKAVAKATGSVLREANAVIGRERAKFKTLARDLERVMTKVLEVPAELARIKNVALEAAALPRPATEADLAAIKTVARDRQNDDIGRPVPPHRSSQQYLGVHDISMELRDFPAKARKAARSVVGDSSLGKGERVILIAVAQQPDGADREQLTVLTGYKRSSRDTYLQRLQSSGLVSTDNGTIRVTDAGIEALGHFDPLPTGEDLQAYWLERLSGGEQAILRVLVEQYPNKILRDFISEQTEYQRSSRDTYLQRLGARKLIVTHSGGLVSASPILFD